MQEDIKSLLQWLEGGESLISRLKREKALELLYDYITWNKRKKKYK